MRSGASHGVLRRPTPETPRHRERVQIPLDDPIPALREFIRVTRPTGHICLVFCANRPAQSLIGRALRRHIARSGRGRFLDHAWLAQVARTAGARHVQTLHSNGPAAALIIHV